MTGGSRAARRWRRGGLGARLVAQRLRQPVPQQPAAGRARARIEQRTERGLAVAGERWRDFQVAPRCRIERDEFACRLDVQRRDVRERRLLRRARIGEQRARRADGERRASMPNASGRACPSASRASARRCRHRNARGRCWTAACRASRQRRVLRQQQLGRLDALEGRRDVGARDVRQGQAAGREVQPRDAGATVVDDE
jgi:hypothetical protein